MTEIEVPNLDIAVVCDVCSKDLDTEEYRGELCVKPCENCLENARQEGRDEG